MTPQEEQLLNALIDRLNQTSLTEKDPDAEALLNQRLAGNPDALYMLAQTVLVQNIALDQAKAQLSQLQQQIQQQRSQPAHTTSFLGRLLGERDEQPISPPQQQAPASGYQQVPPQYIQPPPYGAPQNQSMPYAPAGQPSFLRGAFQTAAGVAAGALAFEGIESMLHGFGHGGYGWGGPSFGAGFGDRPVEVINNNYYDEPGRSAEHSEHHGLNDGGYDPRNNDPNDNLRGFDNSSGASLSDSGGNAANDVSAFADQASFDDQSGLDDQNLDDGSGFDDSGSFDDGGDMDDGSGGF